MTLKQILNLGVQKYAHQSAPAAPQSTASTTSVSEQPAPLKTIGVGQSSTPAPAPASAAVTPPAVDPQLARYQRLFGAAKGQEVFRQRQESQRLAGQLQAAHPGANHVSGTFQQGQLASSQPVVGGQPPVASNAPTPPASQQTVVSPNAAALLGDDGAVANPPVNQPLPPAQAQPATAAPTAPQTQPAPTGPAAFVDAIKQRSGNKEPRGRVIDMTKPLDVNAIVAHMDNSNSNLPPEQHRQFATSIVQTIQNNPQLYEGAQDVIAGNTDTPAAKAYAAQLKSSEDEFVQQQVQQQAAAAIKEDPTIAQNPQTFGQMAQGWTQNAMQSFNDMPMPMKMMLGIGLPLGLMGVMSSVFGEGGMGMGLMGVLGLGAAGLAAAGGGMFGQGAQTAVADGMFNLGQATGMIPQVDPQDLAVLRAEDPLAALREQSGTIGTREDVAAQLERAQGQISSLRKLQMLPAGMQAHFLRRMDPSMSEEDAQRAVQNAGIILQAYDNPDSELSQLRQRGESYANSDGVSGALQENVAVPAMNLGRRISNWWDDKQSSDMNIATKLAYQYKMTKAARCWAGYEPVPGAKAYSRGSCRPVGSKKTQKEMKSGKERHNETTKQSGTKSRTQSQAENQNRAKVRNAG